MVHIPTLETARLRLRAHRLDDFDAYAAMWTEPAVVRYIGGMPFSREQSWSRFLRHTGLWHHLGFGFFALEDKATGSFVGEVGFHDLRRDMIPAVEGTMEAGWALIAPMQGRGLAEEAMRAALLWAETNAAASRFTCIINPDNAASLRVAEKLGFHRFAETTYNGAKIIVFERPA